MGDQIDHCDATNGQDNSMASLCIQSQPGNHLGEKCTAAKYPCLVYRNMHSSYTVVSCPVHGMRIHCIWKPKYSIKLYFSPMNAIIHACIKKLNIHSHCLPFNTQPSVFQPLTKILCAT